LRKLNITSIRLLTNNPAKIAEIKKYGFTSVEREAMPVFENADNQRYLKTKETKMNHKIELSEG